MTRAKDKKPMAGTPNDVRFGTPPAVAAYRAERLCAGVDTVIEVGAGAGFQTEAFAELVEKVIAIDIDQERLSRAQFAGNVVAVPGDALDPAVIAKVRAEVVGRVVVFLDPERAPAAETRTLEDISPNILVFIEAYSEFGDVAIELPPFLDEIPFDCEREYLSVKGELNRLNVYTGGLRTCDVSVVELTTRARLEHSDDVPDLMEQEVSSAYVLEPNKAIIRAGLTPIVIPHPYKILPSGKKQFFLTQENSPWCTTYKILWSGTKEHLLRHLDCEAVVLHGSIDQDAQRALLKELQPHCSGEGKLHLFLGETLYLTTRQ